MVSDAKLDSKNEFLAFDPFLHPFYLDFGRDHGDCGKVFLVFCKGSADDEGMKTTRIFFLFFILLIQLNVQAYSEQNKENSFSIIRIRLFKELTFFPQISSAKIKILSRHLWMVEGLNLHFQDKKLSFRNFIVQNENDKYDIIGIFDFNSYLAGVISKEMPLSWPLEALKAQAVIARSYALARMSERKNRIYHLDTDQMDQVFAMTSSEKAKLAVSLTENVILKDQNDRVLKAYYHSDCGGQTIPATQVWGGALDMGTTIDPWCRQRKSNEWSYEIPKKYFFQKLRPVEVFSDGNEKLEISGTFKDRIQSLKVIEQIFSVQKLRQIFGFSRLRNSPLIISETADAIQFKGKGFGHGVGLCQWGTLAQARLGRSYSQILEHYYPKAQLSTTTMKITKNFLSDLVFN